MGDVTDIKSTLHTVYSMVASGKSYDWQEGGTMNPQALEINGVQSTHPSSLLKDT